MSNTPLEFSVEIIDKMTKKIMPGVDPSPGLRPSCFIQYNNPPPPPAKLKESGIRLVHVHVGAAGGLM